MDGHICNINRDLEPTLADKSKQIVAVDCIAIFGGVEVPDLESTVGTDRRDVTALSEDVSAVCRHSSLPGMIGHGDFVARDSSIFSNSNSNNFVDGVLLFETFELSMLETSTFSFMNMTERRNHIG